MRLRSTQLGLLISTLFILAAGQRSTCNPELVSNQNQCRHVRMYCVDTLPGLLNYYDFVYCKVANAEPLAIFLLVGLHLFPKELI